MNPSQSRAVIVAILSCLAVLGATALPWLRTGDTRRSAFALARGADALGYIDTPGRRVLLVSWYLLPFLTASAWTAGALRRPSLVAALAVLVGGMSIAAGALVTAWVRVEPGPIAAVAAGAAALVCAAWVVRAGAGAHVGTSAQGGRP